MTQEELQEWAANEATNQDLIDTINEVMSIQSNGRAKRIEAEKTLYNMEAELKKKLLSTNL